MYAVLSRSTAHTRNDAPLFALSAESSTPSSAEPGLTLISAISKRLRVKLSDFTADGNFRMLYMAFCRKSFGIDDHRKLKLIFNKVKVFACVFAAAYARDGVFAPMRFARKQLSMFISSEPVAAMKARRCRRLRPTEF